MSPSDIRQLLAAIPSANSARRAEALRHQNRLTKPLGSLGQLEEVAAFLAAFQDAPPRARPAATLHFAADHPVTRHGVSAYPMEVTRAMLANFARGGAASSVLSLLHRIPLHVVDVGVGGSSSVSTAKGSTKALVTVRRDPVADMQEGDLRSEDAMSEPTLERAFSAGAQAVHGLSPVPRLVILGEMGIGNSTLAAAVCAGVLDRDDPGSFVGRGTGASDRVMAVKRAVVESAVARLGPDDGPLEVLRKLGGRELGALLGAMSAALSLRAVVLVDGFIVSAVALVLSEVAPRALDGLLFAHASAEHGHRRVLSHLGKTPLLDLGLCLGEGSGALTAFPLVEAAAELHQKMATFESAAVPNRSAAGEGGAE